MPENALRELLNRLRWDPGAAARDVVLLVRVRAGGSEAVDEVAFADVRDILPGGVVVADGTFLPYHRVTAVRRGGETLWQKTVEA